MKDFKTLYLTLIMLFSVGILIFVIYYEDNTNYDVIYVDDFDTKKFDLYVLDENNEITCIKTQIDKLTYSEVFKLYNEKMNSIEVGYYSPLVSYTNCLELSVSNNMLIIKLESLSKEVNINQLLTCFINTFSYFGIEEIELSAGKSKFYINNQNL